MECGLLLVCRPTVAVRPALTLLAGDGQPRRAALKLLAREGQPAVGAPAPLLVAARCCSWLMMTCTMDRPSYVKLIANHHNQHAHRQSAFAACCLRRFCCRTESVGVDFALDSAFVMRLI